MLGLIWVQAVCHFDGTPERFFKKKLISKKIRRRQKSMQNYPGGKEVNDKYPCGSNSHQVSSGQNHLINIQVIIGNH